MKPATFYGTITSGKFKLNDGQKDLMNLYVESQNDGDIKLTLSRHKHTRSNMQNRYYWGVVVDLIAESTGYTADETHDALKWKFLRNDRDYFPTVRSTTSLNTIEFENLMTEIRNWASAELSVYIPLPNETEFTYENLH